MILVTTSACATGLGASTYRPTVPERPTIEARPTVEPCALGSGEPGACVKLWLKDFETVRLWYLTLERELKAACLALGGSAAECRTE